VDAATGAGKGKNTGTPFAKVMRADATRNDVAVFLELMQKLGRDPYSTPVSCPIGGVGYGGAMGPSQFIPTTWKGLENKIAAAVGASVADPWNPKHAVMATAIFLKDLGAARRTPSAETEAAGRYYAGGSWRTLGAPYSRSVLKFAEEYQNNIDFLNDL
jgi:membrane-bound lytic murein transglycosylase B